MVQQRFLRTTGFGRLGRSSVVKALLFSGGFVCPPLVYAMEQRAEPRGDKNLSITSPGRRDGSCLLSQHHVLARDTQLHLSVGREAAGRAGGPREGGMGADGAGALQSLCGEDLAREPLPAHGNRDG